MDSGKYFTLLHGFTAASHAWCPASLADSPRNHIIIHHNNFSFLASIYIFCTLFKGSVTSDAGVGNAAE